jgi:glycolate oxidase iron-sulfur subunit
MIFDQHALSQCVSCGFCLPSCPTFQVTHKEQHGPRGRIAGMRMVQAGEIDAVDPGYVESMETCVQCRACEPACPSGVRFGFLMEQARAALHEPPEAAPAGARSAGRLQALLTDLGLRSLTSRWLVRTLTVLLALAQATRLDRILPPTYRPARRVRARDVLRPLRPEPGGRPRPGGEPAFLFRGCVMDAWFRSTHQATARVLAAAGYDVRTEPAPACCGALHLHAGREAEARRLAREVVGAYAGSQGIVVVNSAGCGAAMREYGHLLGTPEARAFSARIRDFSEAASPARLPPLRRLDRTVVYQAACHLKNVQRVDREVDEMLDAIPGLTVLRPADGELCCGAGGAYSLLQPELAGRMRARKVEALLETGATLVVSGNPGCMLHLAAAGLELVHTADLVASALPPANLTEVPQEASLLAQEQV